MAGARAPHRVHVFAYQVGFGDCFLLRFAYRDARDRHVLIDFGTVGLPESTANAHLKRIANDIAGKCEGSLDAVVATHRHADHVSGFATAKSGNGPGDVIRSLKPSVVLQPWTEQPDLAEDAAAPTTGTPTTGTPTAATPMAARQAQRRAVAALDDMNAFAQLLVESLATIGKGLSPAIAERIRFLGEDNVRNVSAVRNLATMGGRHVYAYHGARSGLERVLPGVKTHVLGPPTLAQSAAISQMRSRDLSEYWHLQLRRLAFDVETPNDDATPFPSHDSVPGGKLPMHARWIAQRLRQARGEQLLQIVTALDNAMNNTSLILLFDVGGRKMLFPGDAQIENWQFALSDEKSLALLRDVHVYKVGHHGSLNATPKTLWQAFANKGGARRRGRLVTVLSTMSGKHGSESSGTEVPRSTLVRALREHSRLHDTRRLAEGALCEEIVIEVATNPQTAGPGTTRRRSASARSR